MPYKDPKRKAERRREREAAQRAARGNDPVPVCRGREVSWSPPELPRAKTPVPHPLPDLDDAEIDLVRDAIAWSLGLTHTPPPEPGELERLVRSGEAHRILGIMREDHGPIDWVARRIRVAIVDFREQARGS